MAPRPPDELLGRILQDGLRAPSAENRHYLQFEVDDDGVSLLTTDAPTWEAQPHRKMLALLAYGAVIENMQLASAALGLGMLGVLFPDRSRPEVIAHLRWAPLAAAATADPLAAAIPQRHTNRRFYRRDRLDPAMLQALGDAASAVPAARLDWLDEAPRRALALRAIRVAETERFLGARLHRELFGAVRFEHGWHGSTDEWLAPATLEVEPPMRPAFAALRRATPIRLATALGAHHLLGMRAGYLPALSAPHLGLVVAEGPDDEAAIAAGRAMERIWLAAAARGLAFQPMAAVTALARQHAGDGWVRPAVQARLRSALAALLGDRPGQPFLLFRLGRAAPPSAVSGRRPWTEYLAGRTDDPAWGEPPPRP